MWKFVYCMLKYKYIYEYGNNLKIIISNESRCLDYNIYINVSI
jgi:hypothetical protein